MHITCTDIHDVLIIHAKIIKDNRGFFSEIFNIHKFYSLTGLKHVSFVQENHSKSKKGVLRGLHYQLKHPQGKLIRVINGSIFDVAVDLRKSSDTFGKWVGIELNDKNLLQAWIPPGFGHGFMVTSESADVIYKTTDYYFPEYENCITCFDPNISIKWPNTNTKITLSERDQKGKSIFASDVFE
ncbi:MAG: dTDP-4-dehydrorhamnose 3,5-epimerase [Bordetella sp.]|nr:MAG: dTDP-4-dehydrorhamnose 3,5-epimerase [Bordetella sp.]